MSTTTKKTCGKCEKIVYPAEELKCLDKFWHKGCLKCTVCGMTLNVKNVKGYERMPYCHVHYPQPKPTVVANNPEMQRIRLLTDIQSNAKYHEDFNKSKGKFTPTIVEHPVKEQRKETTIGRVADYDPLNDDRGSLARGYEPTSKANETRLQMKVRAMYSYTAGDSDEISFAEGDLLDGCEEIDAGWMFGRNPRTGQQGLLPANYVEILSSVNK